MERWPKMVLCFVTILFVFVATVKGKPVTDIHQNIDNRNSGNRVQIRASRSETGTEMMKRDTSAAENNIELTTKMDRKKRQCSLSPFDVHCHGYCPKTNTRDWEKLIIYWNCSARYEGTTYHCARINTTGQFVEACAVPKNCDKGTKPVITFPRGHKEYAEVDCHKCEENRYNPYEGKRSDSFSVCERVRRDCRRTGFIECDKVAGIERQWTNSKCMCDVRKNFIPVREKESRCSDDDILMCIERVPCPDTPDGKRQEYLLSNHSCSPVCGEGYYQRSAESDECIPKRILTEDSNTTLDVTTDPMDIKPVTVDPVSTTVKNVTVITDVPSDGTNNDRGPPSKGQEENSYTKIVTSILSIPVGIALWLLIRCICLKITPRAFTTIDLSCKPVSWKNAVIAIFCWPCQPHLKVPAKPPWIYAQAKNDKSIWIEWEQSPQGDYSCKVKEYKIKYRKEDQQLEAGEDEPLVERSFQEMTVREITGFTLPDLEPSTEYEICVLASGIVGDSPCSNSVFVTTLFPAPGPARRVNGTEGTQKISLYWDPPSEIQSILGYKIFCRKSSSMEEFDQYETEQPSFELLNLEHKTLYRIKVVAYNESGDSPEEILEKQTLPSAPNKPPRIYTQAKSDKSISVEWEQPSQDDYSCEVKEYKIKYRKIQNGLIEGQQLRTAEAEMNQFVALPNSSFTVLTVPKAPNLVTYFTLPNLEPSTQYEISVLASGIVGDGHCSNSIFVTTDSSSVNTKSKESHPPLPKSNTPNGDTLNGRMTPTREECKRIMERSITKIKKQLKHEVTIEKVIEHQLFEEYQRNDLLHLIKEVPSKANREIWEKFFADVKYYGSLKMILKETGQEDLLMHIQNIEDEERQKNTAANRENDDISTENRDEGDVDMEDTSENDDRTHKVAEDDMSENIDNTHEVNAENIRENDENTNQVSVENIRESDENTNQVTLENTREYNDNTHQVAVENTTENKDRTNQVSVDNTAENNDSIHKFSVEKTAENNDTVNQVSEENTREDNNRMHDNGNISNSTVAVMGSGTCSNNDSH